MAGATREIITTFEAAVSILSHVIDAERLFGEPDYLLRVVARDLAHFQQLYDEQLSGLPGVLRLTTTLVMRSVVDSRPLPVPPASKGR